MAAKPTVYESDYPDIFIPTDISVPQFLARYNPDHVHGDKVVLEDLEEPYDRLTYAGVRHEAAVHAAWLRASGLKPGDAVAIYATNSVAWAKAAYAILWAGGLMVGINAMVSEYELPHYFAVAKPKLIFVDPNLRQRVERVFAASPRQAARIIELGTTSGRGFPYNVPPQQPIPPCGVSGGDNRTVPAVVLFSSGTSGKPKGVHLSHYNCLAHMLGSRGGTPETQLQWNKEIFYPPLAHMFGLVGALLPAASNGGYVVLMRQFDYHKWIVANAKIKATILRSIPTIAGMIAKDPDVKAGKLDLSSVQYLQCAGAALQTEVVASLQKLLQGVSIVQGYGMSECAVSSLRAHRSEEKSGSVGTLFPNTQLRIVDDDLRDVARNTPGQALIKGPSVFLEYRDNPAATKESFVDGWLCTGDVLLIDDDGFLWFKDRKKEMIKYKGNQVAPAELEDILASHPNVVEAGVCAAWDAENQTEVPTAYVVLKAQTTQSSSDVGAILGDIRKFVDDRVTPYKRLRGGVHRIAVLPKNPTGKLVRGELPARKAMEKMLAAPKAKL